MTVVQLPNHVGSLLSKREYHYVLYTNLTPRLEALLSQWLYLTLYHGLFYRILVFRFLGKIYWFASYVRVYWKKSDCLPGWEKITATKSHRIPGINRPKAHGTGTLEHSNVKNYLFAIIYFFIFFLRLFTIFFRNIFAYGMESNTVTTFFSLSLPFPFYPTRVRWKCLNNFYTLFSYNLCYLDLYENFLRVLEDMFRWSPTSFKLEMIDSCRKLIHNLVS